MTPKLEVDRLAVEYPAPGGRTVHAVSGVSFALAPGETLGLVGESGCGKSTTARAIAQHVRATGGTVRLDGRDLSTLRRGELRRARTRLQMIFQDPVSSLNPRRRVEDIVGEGLRIWGLGDARERAEKVRTAMEAVGLSYDPAAHRRRGQFSGGQCQRISIARALVLEPEVLICDEPVSALDVSVQAQILNLLVDLRGRHALTMLFIAHDLAVVRHVSDRVAVMYLGRICEIATPDALYRRPLHPYTRTLLDAIPVPDPDVRPAPAPRSDGVPSPLDPPSGCRFRTRCPRASERCAAEEPAVREAAPGHAVACHHPLAA
ncbi:ABC transporter ATP-binding protein [Actinomadura rugatobispora]|uniref:ABC transporter ATP-binding protein n=1 Tax=Actinomadura rugatobispora TaxID=1994 RepID=A0ABW0ZT30_9ACTN|nr:dipeptide ABC transporter ATP-binding protein [Actinomadura rugatobispora]